MYIALYSISSLKCRYQRTHGVRRSFWEHFVAIFGPRWWTWPLPLVSAPQADYTEPAIADEAELWGQARP